MREDRSQRSEIRDQRAESCFDSPSKKLLIEVENLGRSYQMGAAVLPVLRDVSLKLSAGETVAIVGASGAGKSTLLHIIGGLDEPTRGTVRFYGRDLYGMSARQRTVFRARSVGFVFQFYHLLPELDVCENVMLPAMNSSLWLLVRRLTDYPSVQAESSLRRDSPRNRAMSLLRSVGLDERKEHLPAELSGGEQQRAAVARALVNDPELILADEPTGNLDSQTGAQVLNVLFGLVRDHQRTLLMVTHNAEVAGRCDRVLRLQDGNLTSL